MSQSIEHHPLQPFIPEGAKLLMLGAFPPKQEKWSMEFFYPNFINDMWRIFGHIIYGNKDYFVDMPNKTFNKEEIIDMLMHYGIALGDTAKSVVRLKDNASDKFLQVVEAIDVFSLIKNMPDCVAIATTGEKAASVLASITESELPKVGSYVELHFGGNRIVRHYRMPSSSRAFPMEIENKAEYYRQMLSELGII